MFDRRSSGPTKETVMAKGQMRSSKEKKKPKSDKNKKQKHTPFGGAAAPGQKETHPGFNLPKKG
jgi:hypothetical protein